MKEKSTRREFLVSTSTAIGLAAQTACQRSGNQGSTQANQQAIERLADDPLAAVKPRLPTQIFRPPAPGPALRTNWKPLNVIVIMLDSFRADHLGAFGADRGLTPNLDQFARESAFFTHSYPEGLPTIPVRTSLFTGRFTYPFRGWQVLYPEDYPLLAEILWSEGFRTCLVSDTYHMHKPAYGFSRGFDDATWIRGQEGDPYVRDPSVQVDIEPYYKPRTGTEQEKEQLIQYLKNRHNWRSDADHFTPRVFEAALSWLKRQRRRENLFLWIDNFCPHEPWDPPERWLRKVKPDYRGKRLVLPIPGDVEGYLTREELDNVLALYAGSVGFVDECVGHFLEELKRLGMYENTLIAILTDHGEPLGDHGIVRKHRPWPYEELARTFLMIRHPKAKPRRIDTYTQQTDLTATILDYLSIRPLEGMTSKSLLPLVLGQEEKVRDFAVCCHHMGGLSIRHDEWSYHYYLPGRARKAPGSNIVKSRPELYNLRNDPREQNNLIDDEPERAEQLHRMLQDFTDELIRRQLSVT